MLSSMKNNPSGPSAKRTSPIRGRRRMGAPGALADVVEYAASALGWDVREALYERLKGRD